MPQVEQNMVIDSRRSDELQEIIGKVPNRVTRWGTAVILGILILIIACSWIIKYPEILPVPITLTTLNTPKPLIAKAAGKLDYLAVKEGEEVEQGQVLAWLESTAKHDEVLSLSKKLERLHQALKANRVEALQEFGTMNYNQLGEIQQAYQAFDQAYTSLSAYVAKGFYQKKKGLLENELRDLQRLADNLNEQLLVQQKDFSIAQNEHKTQESLAKDGVISPIEMKREESKLLNKSLPLKQLESSIISNSMSQAAKANELLELDKALTEQEQSFMQSLNTLRSEVEKWKSTYLLIAPIKGQIRFAGRIQEQQSLTAEQEVFFIAPGEGHYFGELTIPQYSMGKVRVGEAVMIKFDAYPYAEFGTVPAEIIHISQIPGKEGAFSAEVQLSQGLKTNYDKQLQAKGGMTGTAEIITDDLRLMERLINNLRKGMN